MCIPVQVLFDSPRNKEAWLKSVRAVGVTGSITRKEIPIQRRLMRFHFAVQHELTLPRTKNLVGLTKFLNTHVQQIGSAPFEQILVGAGSVFVGLLIDVFQTSTQDVNGNLVWNVVNIVKFELVG